MAPGTRDTLEKLKRPPLPRDPLPPEILNYSPRVPFSLDSGKFVKNVRSAKRGAAVGASGMTVEHLRPLTDLVRDQQLFCKVAERLARADVPPSIVEAIRKGRMTALRKTNGGVRGIVVGDVVRRLRAGSECIAHVIQGLTELNPEATVLSIDGISAHDQISRAAMMDGLFSLCGGEAVPCLFCIHWPAFRLGGYSGRTQRG